jgi:hypothetical protein
MRSLFGRPEESNSRLTGDHSANVIVNYERAAFDPAPATILFESPRRNDDSIPDFDRHDQSSPGPGGHSHWVEASFLVPPWGSPLIATWLIIIGLSLLKTSERKPR